MMTSRFSLNQRVMTPNGAGTTQGRLEDGRVLVRHITSKMTTKANGELFTNADHPTAIYAYREDELSEDVSSK